MGIAGYVIAAGVVVLGGAIMFRKRTMGQQTSTSDSDATMGWFPVSDTSSDPNDSSDAGATDSTSDGDGGGGDGGGD